MFLDELLSLFKGEEIKDKVDFIDVDLGYLLKTKIDEITTKRELSNYLLYSYYNGHKDLDCIKLHNSLLPDKFSNIKKKIKSEVKRKDKDFNEYSGKLEDKSILEDIKEVNNKVFSISYLESYSKCPYAFLLNNVFQIQEMERDYISYSPIDIGNVYHQVLRHFYLKYKDDIIDSIKQNKGFNLDNALDNLKTLTIKYSNEAGFDLSLRKDLLIVENIYDRLVEFIKEDFKRFYNSKEQIIPYDFEVEFGKYHDFKIDVNDSSIFLRGVIDRIDKVVGEDKYYIMDYKSSSYGIRKIKDMKNGLSLQLPVYIISQGERNIIGGLYGIISAAKFDISLGIVEESKIISRRNSGALDRKSWDKLLVSTKENIYEIIERINRGDFSVNPLECSSYCIYRDICRYERIVEVE